MATDKTADADSTPEEAGLSSRRLDELVVLAQRFVDHGSDRGISLFVARHGKVVLTRAVGTTTAGEPLTTDTRFLYLSASKAVTAAAVALLADRGLLSLSDPLALHMEELRDGPKAQITVEQLLSHRAGFPDFFTNGVSFEDWCDWDRAIRLTLALPLEYAPGERIAYHPLSFGLLGELVSRVDGRPFERFVADEIAEPLGMDGFSWGRPDDGRPWTGTGIEGQEQHVNAQRLQTPAANAAVIPAGNAWGTARDLGRFYLAMAASLAGRRTEPTLLSRATVDHITRRRFDPEVTTGPGRGLGFDVGTPAVGTSVVGELAGPRTFGHPGMRSTVGWCDPDTDLVVVILCNGTPEQPEGQRRLSLLSDAVHRSVV